MGTYNQHQHNGNHPRQAYATSAVNVYFSYGHGKQEATSSLLVVVALIPEILGTIGTPI